MVTSIWVVSMEFTGEACWEDYSSNSSIYIIVVPILSILLVARSFHTTTTHSDVQINLLLLVSIMKVVVTKLRIRANLSTQQLQVK